MSERPFPSMHPRPLEPATYLHIVLPGACHAGAHTVLQEGDMNKIAPAILASALSATPLAAADFSGVASQPPVPPVVAEEGAPVAPPPPRCRAAVVSGLVMSPWIELLAVRTGPGVEYRILDRLGNGYPLRIPAAGLRPGRRMVCDCRGRLP